MMSLMVSFCLSFLPQDVLVEIWDLIESVSEGFPIYSSNAYSLHYHFTIISNMTKLLLKVVLNSFSSIDPPILSLKALKNR